MSVITQHVTINVWHPEDDSWMAETYRRCISVWATIKRHSLKIWF